MAPGSLEYGQGNVTIYVYLSFIGLSYLYFSILCTTRVYVYVIYIFVGGIFLVCTIFPTYVSSLPKCILFLSIMFMYVHVNDLNE